MGDAALCSLWLIHLRLRLAALHCNMSESRSFEKNFTADILILILIQAGASLRPGRPALR